MRTKVKIIDRFILGLIWTFSILTIGYMLWIVVYIISSGLPSLSWKYIVLEYDSSVKGIGQFILNTIYTVVVSIAISCPIGIASAIYLTEYAKEGPVVNIIRFATETLAGIPSIIYGLFGLIFFVQILGLGWCILSGALTLSIMVLPTIVRATEEALKCVPKSFREGSLALGATKLTTIVKIVIPSAIPGIVAAVILSVGRIVGETAAVYLTIGYGLHSYGFPEVIFQTARTLSVHLFYLAKEGLSFEQSSATAAVLLMLTLIINFITNIISKQFSRKYN